MCATFRMDSPMETDAPKGTTTVGSNRSMPARYRIHHSARTHDRVLGANACHAQANAVASALLGMRLWRLWTCPLPSLLLECLRPDGSSRPWLYEASETVWRGDPSCVRRRESSPRSLKPLPLLRGSR